ncbi:hypothetical protein AURDEDRAFT_77284 [Auricularia subglabra TFB-10046 SS5]|uniref:Uncharacterized protein n=1 Tax=Auricularia subglabra (strain TFB-10046 / SS5) TaxID=717982 RepID=J0WL39_AURST|nr:hypothetical protein AURDEDRAFT_77284 [Auricularia subglabra TFB-10046 SS5]
MDTRADFDPADPEPAAPSPAPSRAPWHPPPPNASPRTDQGRPRAPELLIQGAARHWIAVAGKYGLAARGRKDIAQYLVNRCPSCFAAARTGRPLSECDFHFALDGNFGHRHNCTASNCPYIAYDMQSFVPKEFVDAVGAAHDECRQRPARPYNSVVLLAAVKACESSHTAADGSRVKCGGEKHDDRGLVAIVCRHDVPLFICNVDTPGEQFKYGLALLLWTSMHLPDNATMLCLYDIGCVAHKIVQSVRTIAVTYDLLGEQLEARVAFATSAMHAYAHQWECQIVYSPRLNPSYGLSDGEGCERLWSRIRKLISNLRSAARQMRLITLDRHVQSVADEIRDDSGRWLGRKWSALKTREYEARKEIALSGHSAQFLREQWAAQREAQLEVRRSESLRPCGCPCSHHSPRTLTLFQ